jgi:hypothetical protein
MRWHSSLVKIARREKTCRRFSGNSGDNFAAHSPDAARPLQPATFDARYEVSGGRDVSNPGFCCECGGGLTRDVRGANRVRLAPRRMGSHLLRRCAMISEQMKALIRSVDATDAHDAEVHGILFVRLRLGVTRQIQSQGEPSCQEGESLGKSMIVILFRCGCLAHLRGLAAWSAGMARFST